MTDLKSCPFCGKNPYKEEDQYTLNRNKIACKNSECDLYNMFFNEKFWNTRASPWIKTSDRLPERGKWVLIALSNTKISVSIFGFLSKNGDYFLSCFAEKFTFNKVTHWMPAPELPEDE